MVALTTPGLLILAHYWGIDEMGVFVVPASLAVWALRRAEKHARRKAEASEDQEPADVDASNYDRSVT